ncbi:MAG: hypothetical protein Q7U63_09780 [Polaromonas sp.]|uniref:hypothetical protein n=1 Tax=Polaromonas sp. TaxID=1869339 RepID=UPI002727E487|nr:hypothetical protein [Polaromonas sp.]MDO9114072.1 hypothetical protein [Polaromonas sp.]MDP1885806.1 hypothetical protein [Polaromonas sp.]
MRKNDWRPKILQPAIDCALLIGGFILTTGSSHAVTAVGTASATVVDSVTVVITPPPAPAPVPTPTPAPAVVETPPALSGTVFTVESFTSSLSTSGPLLRVGVAPPAGASGSAAQGGGAAEGGAPAQGATAAQGSVGAGAAPPAASTATVNVTRRADGSLAVSGGSGLTFAVSQPVNGAVNIEYN